MANIILNGKTVVTQTGNDEPLIGGNVLMHSNAINTALSGATFPAGHVVQVVFDQIDTQYVTSTGATLQPTGLKIQITPKFVNSKFYVHAMAPLNAKPAAYGAGVALYARNTLGSMTAWNLPSGILISGGYLYSNAASDLWTEGSSFGFYHGPSYNLGETLEFEMYFGSIGPGADGSTTVRFGHNGFTSNIIVMEIVQ